MATTTNYGWTTPDDTALVKDGAAAIRSLGSAIDTSMNTALGTKKAGLVLISNQTFTGVTSISAANSTFTSTFANYRILLDLTSTATDATFFARMRNAGSDDTGLNYDHAIYAYASTNSAAGLAANVNVSAWYPFEVDAGTSNHSYSMSMDLFRPQEAQFTTFSLQGQYVSTGGTRASCFGGGWLKTTTQYDAITFYTTGNMAGRLTIYGYNL